MTAHSSTHSRRRRLGLLAVSAASLVSLATAGIAIADPAGASASSAVAAALPWMDTSLAPEQRAVLLLEAMTLDQKLQQLTGASRDRSRAAAVLRRAARDRHPGAGHPHACASPTARSAWARTTASIPPLRATRTRLHGVAYTHPSSAKATALPSATAVAASFDPAVARGVRRRHRHRDEQPGAARLRGAGREHGPPAGARAATSSTSVRTPTSPA